MTPSKREGLAGLCLSPKLQPWLFFFKVNYTVQVPPTTESSGHNHMRVRALYSAVQRRKIEPAKRCHKAD
jgi:hypothetical protein